MADARHLPHGRPPGGDRHHNFYGNRDNLLDQGQSDSAAAYQVILTGRATSVPFTPVFTGPERIPTDNPTAAVTCAIHGHPADVRDEVAQVLGVTEEDRQIPLPSGTTTRYANRIAWAVTHMAQARLLERPQRGVTQITSRGRDVLAKHPDRVDMSVLAQFPEYVEFRSWSSRQPRKEPSGRPAPEVPSEHLSPNEAITEVIDEAHSTVAGDLLARILARPPLLRDSWRPAGGATVIAAVVFALRARVG